MDTNALDVALSRILLLSERLITTVILQSSLHYAPDVLAEAKKVKKVVFSSILQRFYKATTIYYNSKTVVSYIELIGGTNELPDR